MARLNVYVPDELAERARAAGVNISGITQDAIRNALAQSSTDHWLQRLERLPRTDIEHARVIAALDDARADFGG